jgi:hypothetical protein
MAAGAAISALLVAHDDVTFAGDLRQAVPSGAGGYALDGTELCQTAIAVERHGFEPE